MTDATVLALPSLRADVTMMLRWISLGAVAGGIGGLVVGGIGGRLAMLTMRLTTGDRVKGTLSDDGFVIGRIDLGGTLQLFFLTAALGTIGGLFVVVGRPFFRTRWMPVAWAVAGALIAGSIIIRGDGIDFTVLEPRALAFAFFITIPAVGAFLIAWLSEAIEPWWWTNRRRTIIASVVGLAGIVPLFALVIPPAVVLVAGGGWLLAIRSRTVRALNTLLPVRIAAWAVYGVLVGLGGFALLSDARNIL